MEYYSVVDKRVYKVLQKCCDAPVVLFCSGTLDPILWRRENSRSKPVKVVLVCTEYYTYLLKRKKYAFISRWPNRLLTINAQNATVVLSCSEGPFSHSLEENDAPLFRESSLSRAAYRKRKTLGLQGATLIAVTSREASNIEEKVFRLISAAGRTAEMLEREEAGDVLPKAADDVLQDHSENDSKSDHSLDIAGVRNDFLLERKDELGKMEELLRLVPSRYITLTSLVDGDFAEYTMLRNAYLRHEEAQLIGDLEMFIKENEGRVEALCQVHYASFIRAVELCLSISSKDADTVSANLGVANEMVKKSVMNVKEAASNLLVRQTTCTNLESVRCLLELFLNVAEHLETAESQVEKKKLRSAVIAIRELASVASPLVSFALGEYVLHRRVPALINEVFAFAVQHLNTWLQRLRQESLPIGMAAFQWEGSNVPGSVVKELNFDPSGDWWWLSEKFLPSKNTSAIFRASEAVLYLCNGAGIQNVFKELHRLEDFRRYYHESRVQQMQADFFNANFSVNGMSPEQLVEYFHHFCAKALGFVLIEDIVHTATYPQVQSCSEILQTWSHLTTAIAARLSMVSGALAGDEGYSSHMLHIVDTMRLLLRHSIESVKSVELSPLRLMKVIESYTDNLVSVWLQEACVAVTEAVSSDPLLALVAYTPEEFEKYVTQFHLHIRSSLELNIPATFPGAPVTLPYSKMIPGVGMITLGFLNKCYNVMVLDNSSAIRHSELNNVDEMLLKYLSILFRTFLEGMRQLDLSGGDSVLKCATLVSSCTVMPVIVSFVEQQFLLHWPSDAAVGKQKLGCPKLLKSSADLFGEPLQDAVEKMLSACIADVKTRLALSSTVIYWYKQIDLRQTNEQQRASEECFRKCIDYILQLIPQLSALLPGVMIRSVIGTAVAHMGQGIQNCLETALKRAYAGNDHNFDAMRACVEEYDKQCTMGVPQWQELLRSALPGLTAISRFPLDAKGAVEGAKSWIANREAQEAEERSNVAQKTVVEDMGKALTRGIQSVGKTLMRKEN